MIKQFGVSTELLQQLKYMKIFGMEVQQDLMLRILMIYMET